MKTAFFTLPSLFATVMLSVTAEASATGAMTFKGTVNGGTCDLQAGDVNRTITLTTVKVSDFDNASSIAEQDFELKANCDSDISTVTFNITGTFVPELKSLFANAALVNPAGNVHTRLSSVIGGSVQTIWADGSRPGPTVNTNAGVAVLPLRASYWKTGPVSKGVLLSTATISINYN